MKEFRTRKNIRLKTYDYFKKGMYFITICTKNRECILSKIENLPVGASIARPQNDDPQDNCPKDNVFCDVHSPQKKYLKLTEEGKIVDIFIRKIEKIYNNVIIDEYVIMPNHIHILLIIKNKDKTLSKIIQQFKGAVTKEIGYSIWQKLFYDHIIHDNEEYLAIKKYIKNNPNTWENDSC